MTEPPPQCRICGGFHLEMYCPKLSGTVGGTGGTPPPPPPKKEEDLIRVKDLDTIVVFPACPTNSSENRGYMNTVLTTIGKAQKGEGNDAYKWGLKALQASTEKECIEYCQFPRLRRAVAAPLVALARCPAWRGPKSASPAVQTQHASIPNFVSIPSSACAPVRRRYEEHRQTWV